MGVRTSSFVCVCFFLFSFFSVGAMEDKNSSNHLSLGSSLEVLATPQSPQGLGREIFNTKSWRKTLEESRPDIKKKTIREIKKRESYLKKKKRNLEHPLFQSVEDHCYCFCLCCCCCPCYVLKQICCSLKNVVFPTPWDGGN